MNSWKGNKILLLYILFDLQKRIREKKHKNRFTNDTIKLCEKLGSETIAH